MTVYFANKEPIDLSAIALMGVSVKTGDNPIGYFGTGLKFAIATLLRTGHEVSLSVGGRTVDFTTKKTDIRGEEFDVIHMGDDQLGFTTMLGRNWEDWQAYRELYSNCLDEGGIIDDALPPGEWGTIFAVKGEGVEKSHRERDSIFLSGQPEFETSEVEIHRGMTQFAYYRGVRAHQHQFPAKFTYNIKASLTLTEDRTVKEPYSLRTKVAKAVLCLNDEDILDEILLAGDMTFESGLDLDWHIEPSDAFMSAVGRLRGNLNCNRSAIETWIRYSKSQEVYEPVALDEHEVNQFLQSQKLLYRLGCSISLDDFMVVENLGPHLYGAVRNKRILISKSAFDMGARFLASTLYEEWLHLHQSMEDETRALQNLLFEKLLSMTERVVFMEER